MQHTRVAHQPNQAFSGNTEQCFSWKLISLRLEIYREFEFNPSYNYLPDESTVPTSNKTRHEVTMNSYNLHITVSWIPVLL